MTFGTIRRLDLALRRRQTLGGLSDLLALDLRRPRAW